METDPAAGHAHTHAQETTAAAATTDEETFLRSTCILYIPILLYYLCTTITTIYIYTDEDANKTCTTGGRKNKQTSGGESGAKDASEKKSRVKGVIRISPTPPPISDSYKYCGDANFSTGPSSSRGGFKFKKKINFIESKTLQVHSETSDYPYYIINERRYMLLYKRLI